MRVLKKIARSELPTTTNIGSPSPTVMSGTINGPPPKPNIEETTAIIKPPIHPKIKIHFKFLPPEFNFHINLLTKGPTFGIMRT